METAEGQESDGDGGRRRVVAIVAAVIVCVLGAGAVVVAVRANDGSGGSRPGTAAPSSEASPFEVLDEPDGYRLVRAGDGELPPSLGGEHEPMDEPFTLLTADGTPAGDRAVAVSYVIDEGGDVPPQIARPDEAPLEASTVDGVEVRTVRSLDATDVLVRRSSDGLWVRASTAHEVAVDDPGQVARAVPVVEGEARSLAPELDEGVAGLRTVGSMDAVVVAALDAYGDERTFLGPTGARVAIWASETVADDQVLVRTVPGRAGDLDVVGRHPWLDPRRVGEAEVDGRRSIHLTCGYRCRATVLVGESGDLVVVTATSLDHAALDRIAGSVTTVDETRWHELAERAFGGPGLHPDPGAEEVARGSAAGVDWLLQTVPRARQPHVESGASTPDGGNEEFGIEVEYGIDECIKLDDLTRACGSTSGGQDATGRASSVVPFVVERPGETERRVWCHARGCARNIRRRRSPSGRPVQPNRRPKAVRPDRRST